MIKLNKDIKILETNLLEKTLVTVTYSIVGQNTKRRGNRLTDFFVPWHTWFPCL